MMSHVISQGRSIAMARSGLHSRCHAASQGVTRHAPPCAYQALHDRPPLQGCPCCLCAPSHCITYMPVCLPPMHGGCVWLWGVGGPHTPHP